MIFKLQLCLVVIFLCRIQKCQNALSSSVTMRNPHSNAFIDLNKDFTAGESAIFLQNLVPGNMGEMQHFNWMQDISAQMCYRLQMMILSQIST